MKISREVYDALEEWKNNLLSSKRIYAFDFDDLYRDIEICYWWRGHDGGTDANNRLIAIIRWVNGEDVFEVEKPKKWVVRSKGTDDDGEYWWLSICEIYGLKRTYDKHAIELATKFDTKEEAESWANSHQEVIEVNND